LNKINQIIATDNALISLAVVRDNDPKLNIDINERISTEIDSWTKAGTRFETRKNKI